ncbi:MAG: recombinase family protein [Dysgonamonadaceae bacterium]|jgi:DNA invertase Pin-like site-specific DNA recombinase|nr:recombinase family protein [Dysgonamonadaceae bacterium]
MIYGYARVSTRDQNLELQTSALQKYGVDKILTEKISGRCSVKPVLASLLKHLKNEDILVIWKLDRLGRIASELMQLQIEFDKNNISLVSITESLDTSSPIGKFVFHMMCGISEMERNVISERTCAGLSSARELGRVGGRRPGLSKQAKETARKARLLYEQNLIDKKYSMARLSELVGISKSTFYKYLRYEGINI